MNKASWFRRWYWLGIPPVCGLLGLWLGTLLIPNWIVALSTIALTLSVSGVMYWSNMRWIDRQKERLAQLATPPLDPRVVEELWRAAQKAGLASEADVTAIIARNKVLNEHTEYRIAKGRQTTIKNEEHGE